jgi:hypothetical protein
MHTLTATSCAQACQMRIGQPLYHVDWERIKEDNAIGNPENRVFPGPLVALS